MDTAGKYWHRYPLGAQLLHEIGEVQSHVDHREVATILSEYLKRSARLLEQDDFSPSLTSHVSSE